MTVPRNASFALAMTCLIMGRCFDFSLLGSTGEPGGPDEPPFSRVRSVEIEPDSITLSVGQSATLRAIVTLVDDSVLPLAPVEVFSSDFTVAEVAERGAGSLEETWIGEVAGRKSGEAWITASYVGKSDRTKVTVN